MAFLKKLWEDRLTQFPRRRSLTPSEGGDTQVVDISRAEGEIYQEGDAWNAQNMNDLEERIEDAFNEKVDKTAVTDVLHGGTGATTVAAARTALGVPPTNHASSATTYGVGNYNNYGHVKLSSTPDGSKGESSGTAATPAAVADARAYAYNQDLFKVSKAGDSVSGDLYPSNTSVNLGKPSNYFNTVFCLQAYTHGIHDVFRGTDAGYFNIFTYDLGNRDGVVQVVSYDAQTFRDINARAFNVISSKRYKKNIKNMTDEQGKLLLKLRPVTFDYKAKCTDSGCMGLIAEEVAEVETYPIYYNGEQVEGLDYSKFIPQLIKLCQIQQDEIDELKKRIEKLESK